MDSHTPRHYNLASNKRRKEIGKRKESGPNYPNLHSNRSKMAKNFYQHSGLGGQVLHGINAAAKNTNFAGKGFCSSGIRKDLRQVMDDINALDRCEIRVKPTTAQEALEIYKRDQDIRGRAGTRGTQRPLTTVVKSFKRK